MAVRVADTIKPKNDLDFPVVEQNDVKGGFHVVKTMAERNAYLNSEKCEPGMLIYVVRSDERSSGRTYQVNDAGDGFTEFNGAISNEKLQTILEYVQDNFEGCKLTEENGKTYLDLF